MESNIYKAESLIRYQQSIVENARDVFPLVHVGADSTLEAADIVTAGYWASAIESPNWNDATHQELLSSGRYVILESAVLRGELLQFYEQIVPTRQMFDLASTEYREAIRSEFNPELQIAIRLNCDRFEGSCKLDGFGAEIDQHASWMRGNADLARKLGRIIPQSERGVEYATRIKEASISLIGLLEAETKAN